MNAGTYRLCKSVTNPHPDRRANQDRLTSWHCWCTWPVGMAFIVEPDPEFKRTRIYAKGGYSMYAVMEDSPAFTLLVNALEPVTESPADYLERRHGSMAGGYALRILDKMNVPESEIVKLLAEIDAEELEVGS